MIKTKKSIDKGPQVGHELKLVGMDNEKITKMNQVVVNDANFITDGKEEKVGGK